MRIVDGNGVSQGTYRYDAWGDILYSTNSTLMNTNPLRHRGYVYDTETELYYLVSRYYDPTIGRFINADGQINNGILGSNLYAYCENDPVNLCDCTGNCAHTAGMIVCGHCQEAMDNKEFWCNRPKRLDINSSVPPTMINPYHDFGAPNANNFYLFEFAVFKYYVSHGEAIGRQRWAQSRMIQHNVVVDVVGELASTIVGEYLEINYKIPSEITGIVFEKVVTDKFKAAPEKVNILPGAYVVTVALYTDGNTVMMLKRIDGPQYSSLVHGWSIRGDIYTSMEERGQLWGYFER